MTWSSHQQELKELIARGELKLATERFQQLAAHPDAPPGEIVKNRQCLTQALVQRSKSNMASDHLPDSWNDLMDARLLATENDRLLVDDQIAQLVEVTVEQAQAKLTHGRASCALQLAAEIERRGIDDWRVDQIIKSGRSIKNAEQLSSEGKFEKALETLEMLQERQPEIETLNGLIKSFRQRSKKLAELSKQLQATALECRWIEVGELCEQILDIAPRHEIALAAKKHSCEQMKRRTSAGSRITNVPEPKKSDSFFQAEPKPQSGPVNRDAAPINPDTSKAPEDVTTVDLENIDSFLAWVDGVGGYLICIRPECMIGQATDDSNVDIPLQADLRMRHARIELISGQHLVQPLGDVSVDEENQDAAFVLRDGQVLGLGNGVKLTYSQTHPYSKTSRLDFTSRHRTRPWSDAVLLASQSVIMGPSRHNHVFCPRWKEDLIFFCRKNQWYCRSRRAIIVDNVKHEQEAPIQFNSHITGADFSLTLEPVVRQNPRTTVAKEP